MQYSEEKRKHEASCTLNITNSSIGEGRQGQRRRFRRRFHFWALFKCSFQLNHFVVQNISTATYSSLTKLHFDNLLFEIFIFRLWELYRNHFSSHKYIFLFVCNWKHRVLWLYVSKINQPQTNIFIFVILMHFNLLLK